MKKIIAIIILGITNPAFSQEEGNKDIYTEFSKNQKIYEKILVKKCKDFAKIKFEIEKKSDCLYIIEKGVKFKNKNALNLLADSLLSGVNISKNEELANKIRVE